MTRDWNHYADDQFGRPRGDKEPLREAKSEPRKPSAWSAQDFTKRVTRSISDASEAVGDYEILFPLSHERGVHGETGGGSGFGSPTEAGYMSGERVRDQLSEACRQAGIMERAAAACRQAVAIAWAPVDDKIPQTGEAMRERPATDEDRLAVLKQRCVRLKGEAKIDVLEREIGELTKKVKEQKKSEAARNAAENGEKAKPAKHGWRSTPLEVDGV